MTLLQRIRLRYRGRSIGTKALALTLPLIVAVTAVAAWAVHARHTANLQEKLTQRARSLHAQIMTDRQYYASVIVPRVVELGGSLGADYRQVHGRFPLPATFVREVSDLTAKIREGYSANLISPWPINKNKGPADQLQRDAFDFLMTHPTGQFVRTDTMEGQAVMRVLMADRASAQSCVDCHNAHPQSPKRDFKLNDLMGGLEIVIPMDQYAQEARRDLALTVAGGAGLCLLVIGIVATGTKRTVTRPLGTLVNRMRAFAGETEGRPSTPAGALSPGDEVAQLEKTFDGMVETIAYKENELQDANARLEQRVVERTQALQSLVEAARQLTAEPHLERLLQDVIETARRLTKATYGALVVFDETGERLTQFVISGMDEATKAAIGPLPTGKGLLGHLAKEDDVLRLKDLTQHPAAVGFPLHHPPMRSFLGVSVRAHGRLFGRLYLTDKQGPGQEIAEFTELDERVIAGLAAQAGAAIETAQLLGEVQAAAERYRVTMASLPVAVVRLGKDRTIRLANRAFYELLHRRPEDTIGQPISAVLPVEGIEEYLQASQAGGGGAAEWEAECLIPSGLPAAEAQAGERRVLRLTVSGIRREEEEEEEEEEEVLVIEDYTERKRVEEALRTSEEQFREAQKMEVVGRLAGGIAHDFNNLLTVITGSSEFLLRALDPQQPLYKDVQEIRNAAERAASLTQQLLAFGRKQPRQPHALDLNEVITALAPMLQRLVGEDIRLALALAPDPCPIMADSTQLEQVLLNLAINARDAMAAGGALTVETHLIELDKAHVMAHLGGKPGTYVLLVVSDTGVGMDADTQAHCFEPFFTTKPAGQGTGLGLATVYGIVKQSDGVISVDSEPGQGTTFKICLPRSEAAVPGEAPAPVIGASPRGTETILLVEDEAGVRSLARRILMQQGYTVLEAGSGEQALTLVAQYAGPIHVVVTDVVMPEMSGPEVVRRLTPLRPGVTVLYISGYTEEAIATHGVRGPAVSVLPKPFTPEQLARTVRELLDRP